MKPTLYTPAEDRNFETSHGRISVRDSMSDGLPVVLIHGNSCSKEVFAHQFASSLAREFRLIAIDLPGHGQSGDALDPTRTYSFKGYASAVLEVLELMGIDHAAFLGWSLGGHVALQIMASSFDVVGVMLTGTPPIGRSVQSMFAAFRLHPDQMLVGKAALSAAEVERLQQLVAGDIGDATLSAALERADGRARQQLMTSCLSGGFADQRQIVETSPVPVAVVNGGDDAIVNTDYFASLAFANLWEGECRVLQGVGHMPFAQVPDLFNTQLKRFLREAEAGACDLRPPLSLSA